MKVTIDNTEFELDVTRALRDGTLTPARVPQPGEVWEFTGEPCLVMPENRYAILSRPIVGSCTPTICKEWSRKFLAGSVVEFILLKSK